MIQAETLGLLVNSLLEQIRAQLPRYLEKASGNKVKKLLPNVWKAKKSNENPTQI